MGAVRRPVCAVQCNGYLAPQARPPRSAPIRSAPQPRRGRSCLLERVALVPRPRSPVPHSAGTRYPIPVFGPIAFAGSGLDPKKNVPMDCRPPVHLVWKKRCAYSVSNTAFIERTAAALLLNSACSASFKFKSMMRSQPFLPITTGTPKQMSD